MAEEDYDLFCTHCGQRITKDTAFCPSCGMQVGEEPQPQNSNDRFNVYRPDGTRDMSGRLLFLSIVFALSAAYFLYDGINTYINIESTLSQLMSSSFWPDLVQMMSETAGYTEEQFIDMLRTTMKTTAIMFIVGGAAMAIAAVCGFTKKLRVVGLICCIVATICTAITLLGLFVGLLLTYLYATTKPCFTS